MMDRIVIIYYHVFYMGYKKPCFCRDYYLSIDHEMVKYVYEPHFDIERCFYELFHIIIPFKSDEPLP